MDESPVVKSLFINYLVLETLYHMLSSGYFFLYKEIEALKIVGVTTPFTHLLIVTAYLNIYFCFHAGMKKKLHNFIYSAIQWHKDPDYIVFVRCAPLFVWV